MMSQNSFLINLRVWELLDWKFPHPDLCAPGAQTSMMQHRPYTHPHTRPQGSGPPLPRAPFLASFLTSLLNPSPPLC